MSVIAIHGKRENFIFSEEEALKIIPVLLHITRQAKNDVNQCQALLKNSMSQNKEKELEDRIEFFMRKWSDKVSKLGATPIGVWKVIIPSSGKSPYEWEFPSSKLSQTM